MLDLLDTVVVPPGMLEDEREEGVHDDRLIAVTDSQSHHHQIPPEEM